MSIRSFPASLLVGALAAATCVSALAQPSGSVSASTAQAATSWDSDQVIGGPSTGNYNTPEADGRPGEYYFHLGADAVRHKDYAHAIAMYKVAASWAFKPAEYDLALMYFRGDGVPMDRARGAAWMVLAAERNDSKYARARDLMITSLSNAEFTQTNAIWQALKSTYGDDVALHRAKARWADVKASMTGSRVGDGALYLTVGSGDGVQGPPLQNSIVPGAPGTPVVVAGWGLFSGTTTDGSIAYQQFQISDNPYDPRFLSGGGGTVTVGPLTPVKTGNDDSASKKSDDNTHNL